MYDGLKRNTSISNLQVECNNHDIIDGVVHEILKVYQENNNLTDFWIENANLQHGGEHIIETTLRNCRNISHIILQGCNMTGEQLIPIVEAVRRYPTLEKLSLAENNIGNVGCEALATLLADPNSNIQTLDLETNQIGNEGATAIANSLANKTKLKSLDLQSNPFDESVVEDVFSSILCNTSSINSTYASNHSLERLRLSFGVSGQLSSLLKLNKDRNKSCVAIKKILKYHPNIDMEPLFEWDAEGEQTLKALPYIVDWFGRAEVAVADRRGESYRIEEKKLSAIFQFTTSMPLLFVPTSHINIKVDNKKRKRDETK